MCSLLFINAAYFVFLSETSKFRGILSCAQLSTLPDRARERGEAYYVRLTLPSTEEYKP